MNVSIGPRWEGFVAAAVESGRYGSASEVIREGLRLVEEREVRLHSLKETLEASIAGGGDHADADVSEAIRARLDAWEQGRKEGDR